MVSRVAKAPIEIPKGVEVKVSGNHLAVKGKLGELKIEINRLVSSTVKDQQVQFLALEDSLAANALAGTSRALVNNLVKGVTEGYSVKLVMVGVGYRAQVQGKKLNLTIGFSHPVVIEAPEGITFECPVQTEILVKGMDKQKVTQLAANIRAVRPPEPYKGKGIRYVAEKIILKEGKKK